MRGGYRPAIGGQHLPRHDTLASRRQRNADEEEFVALNQPGGEYDSSDYDDNSDDDKMEMQQIDIRRSIDNSGEKRDLTYHHGDETFGDVLSHPIDELHAHRKRKEDYEERQHKARSG
jgi:hypothetical protein